MKSAKRILSLLGAMAIICSCGEKNTSKTDENNSVANQSIELSSDVNSQISESSQATKKIDVSLPTEIPLYGEDSVQIHYLRKDGKYAPWSLWLWSEGKDGARYEFNYEDEVGVVASYTLSELSVDPLTGDLGFIVAKNPGTTWDGKDTDGDRFIDFDSITKDENGVYHVYIFSSDANVYTSPDKIIADKIDDLYFKDQNTVTCSCSNPISKFEIYENGVKIAEEIVAGKKTFTYKFDESHPFSFENSYSSKVTFKETNATIESPIAIQKLLATAEFNDKYYYDGELGAILDNGKTTFKVWSPVSNKMVLKVYNSGTPKSVSDTKGDDTVYKEIEMTKNEKGVYETTIYENLEGKYYTYTAYNYKYTNGKETIDPYAKSAGVNGIRGQIVDFSKTNPEGWELVNPLSYDRKSLTVWETHVADVTSSATWTGKEENRKKFLGLVEENTTYTQGNVTVKTGFDHIKELGVNAVQLIPIFDQANDEINTSFNWGYNPLNYNVLEGSYSSNPYDGYTRIREFKEVVKKFNENGINIIMDVVYNHTNGAQGSSFDVLVPGYYYRYTSSGSLYNGSGCGNETASENKMMRKFMIDSAKFWASEYKLGGFRFDLMGLHDLDTMEQLTTECKKLNPNICIYGEPWTGGTSGLASTRQAIQANTSKYVGYGAFNDKIRDALIKGGLAGKEEKGWADSTYATPAGEINQLISGIKGEINTGMLKYSNPNIGVAYATCHDNYTLYDRFKAAGIEDDATIKKMAMLANSVVFTSQGTTFMLAGEEMLRTKQGNSNSYNSSYEINELDYALKIKNLDMFENYKKLINLKQSFAGLQFEQEDAQKILVMNVDTNSVLKYKISDGMTEYYIIHSNGAAANNKSEIDLTGYNLYLDTLGKLEEGSLGKVTPEAYQTIIAYRELVD